VPTVLYATNLYKIRRNYPAQQFDQLYNVHKQRTIGLSLSGLMFRHVYWEAAILIVTVKMLTAHSQVQQWCQNNTNDILVEFSRKDWFKTTLTSDCRITTD